jgi:UDP-N-acetylmuramoyl-tripeptide--D-alanyl-D-alanine ligase
MWTLGKGKKKIAVVGTITHNEGIENEIHLMIGDMVVENDVNILITVGSELKDLIAHRAMERGMKENQIYKCQNGSEVFGILDGLADNNTIVLIKADGFLIGPLLDMLQKKEKQTLSTTCPLGFLAFRSPVLKYYRLC